MKISKIYPRKIAIGILFLIVCFIAMCLSSCVTIKQRERICKTCITKDSIVSKDSVWILEVRDTFQLPPIPGPVVFLKSPCDSLCDSLGNLKPYFRKKNTNGITATISTRQNALAFECNADSVIAYYQGREKHFSHSKETVKTIESKCDKYHPGKFDIFFLVSGRIAWILMLIVVGWRVIKSYFLKR